MAIEGLKLSITSTKLKELVEQRIEYHAKKAAFCEGKAGEAQKEQQEWNEMAEAQFKGLSNQGPGVRWEDQLRHHRDRVTIFTFMRTHLIPDETYILGEEDLRKLEVLPRHW
jgi:hypothetical protein